MKQLNIALGDDIRAFLEESAQAKGQTLAAEVRGILERALNERLMDRPTLDVMAGVAHAGSLVRTHYGFDWHQHPDAHAAFMAALTSRVHRWAPKEKPSGKPPHEAEPVVISADSGPQMVGVAIEGIMNKDRLGIEQGVQAEYLRRMLKHNRAPKLAKKGGKS